MIIIADASSLILMEKVGLLEVLCNEHRIIIPKQIYKEAIIRGLEQQHNDAAELNRKVASKKISVLNVADSEQVKELMMSFGLAQGESEAICLLREDKGDVVAVDDLKAMKYCDKFDLPFITTIALLLDANHNGIVRKETAKQMLKDLAVYGRYKDEIIFYAFDKLEGGKNG